jgi:hypothetical protein
MNAGGWYVEHGEIIGEYKTKISTIRASPSNSLTRRCNTPCAIFNVWRIRAKASRKEAAGSL